MVLLGQLMASCNDSDHVVVESHHLERERQKKYTTFHHTGKIVCGKTFRFLHTVGRKRVYNLAKGLVENGLSPRTHGGNAHRRPKHSLSYGSTEYVVCFLISYAEQNALLPGCSDIKLLPSRVLRRGIWKVYHTDAEEDANAHAVAYNMLSSVENSPNIGDHYEADERPFIMITNVEHAIGTVQQFFRQ